jgi:hypothetical protein
MSKKQTHHPHKSSSRQDERTKYLIGAKLAILAIVLFIILEAWGYYVVKTVKPEFLAYQYFRFILEVPMALFFYKGYKWALWLIRVGFVLGAPAAISFCVLLIHKDAYLFIVPTALIPIAVAITGSWILFASENFLHHFKHKRHERSIYD